MANDEWIRNDGHAFSTFAAAAAVRDAKNAEGNGGYTVEEVPGGFAVAPPGTQSARVESRGDAQPATGGEDAPSSPDRETDTPPASTPTVLLRPALRSQLGAVVRFVVVITIAAMAPEIAAWIATAPDPVGPWVQGQTVSVPVLGSVPLVQAVIGGLMGLWALGIALRIFFSIYYYTFLVEPDRVTVQTGIIARHRRTLRFQNARIPTLEQGFVDRMLRVGEVRLSSAGGGETGEIRMHGLRRPLEVKEEIQRRIDGSWSRPGGGA